MSIEETIKEILVSKIYVEANPTEISSEDHFHRDLGVDSIGFVELRSQVEEVFGVTVTDDDFNPDNFVSVGSLSTFIEKLQAENPEAK